MIGSLSLSVSLGSTRRTGRTERKEEKRKKRKEERKKMKEEWCMPSLKGRG
jgi:hypothetical protein